MSVAPPRWKVVAAFAALYMIWGSTYLAILYAIETLPPFLMAASRFLTAGALMLAWALPRAPRLPSAAEWRAAAVVGGLLLLGGNGAVVWAEQHVPSGVAALLVAVTPAWMVLLDWQWKHGPRPGARTVAGLVLGFLGIALLLGPESLMGAGSIHVTGAIVLVFGSLCWSTGSIYSRAAPSAPGPMVSTAMQMLAGGGLLVLAGAIAGEPARLDLAAVSARSVSAVLYLIVFGSIIGYSAYIWLLRVVSPARVATYAYVNPLVAVLLGWLLAREALTARMAAAAVVIIGGVVLITLQQQQARPAAVEAAALRERS
jgi:drug/metabolite transporter (DMT)-like permease